MASASRSLVAFQLPGTASSIEKKRKEVEHELGWKTNKN
jgi:hypothetical protein